jgi:hypothetical protein
MLDHTHQLVEDVVVGVDPLLMSKSSLLLIPIWKKALNSLVHCRRRSCCGSGISHLLFTSSPGCLIGARLTGIVLEWRWRPDWGKVVVHGGGKVVHGRGRLGRSRLLATGDVAAVGEGEGLPAGGVVGGFYPGLGVVEANVVDAVALLGGAALVPAVVLLRVAGDLHRRLGLDEVLGDVLPVATAVHT